jgi:hypothetical protein
MQITMRIFTLLLVTLLCQTFGFAQDDFQTYRNARYGYSIVYPANLLIPQPEAQNGDGRKFRSRDGKIVLTVFGRQNVSNRSLKAETDKALADWKKDGATVTFWKRGKNYFAISGYVGNNIFYEKTVQRGGQFNTYFYEYPKTLKKRMDVPVNRAFASFN